MNVFDDVKYQEVLGFGGAFTESSEYLYSLLSREDKRKFLELYFNRKKGIGYNFDMHPNRVTVDQEGNITHAEFDIDNYWAEPYDYVRISIVDKDGKKAWTNPIFYNFVCSHNFKNIIY